MLREHYRFTPAGSLHPEGKNAAKTCINRIRRHLAAMYLAITGVRADRDLLIETKPQHGYRLDPTINVVTSARDPM